MTDGGRVFVMLPLNQTYSIATGRLGFSDVELKQHGTRNRKAGVQWEIVEWHTNHSKVFTLGRNGRVVTFTDPSGG